MPYENSAGLAVNNHYGPRTSGGTEGVTNTSGVGNEFTKSLLENGLGFGFPSPGVGKPSVWVTLADISRVEGTTLGAVTIGGVDVTAATKADPVEIPAGNSGEVAVVNGTGGEIVIYYNKYPEIS